MINILYYYSKDYFKYMRVLCNYKFYAIQKTQTFVGVVPKGFQTLTDPLLQTPKQDFTEISDAI